uniref:Uncharacterized protein n=1 Tax=Romanomermis culicivorax TaxID=13658 RepID=A0A915IF68_ROMCU
MNKMSFETAEYIRWGTKVKRAPRLDARQNFDRSRHHPITLPDVDLKGKSIREVENYDWDTEYQMGPETFLMQHRDADFAARIRDYRRRLFGDTATMLDAGYLGAWNRDVSVRERRRYTDFLKSDKDAQRMIRILDHDIEALKTGAAKRAQNLQVLPAPLPKPDGFQFFYTCAPIFYVRLCDMVFNPGSEVLFQCSIIGHPKAQVAWFHDEAIVVDDPRHKMSFDKMGDGKAVLHISDAQYLDSGLYKCVATNDNGQTSCMARLKVGEHAARCTRPDVMLASDTEVFITWEPPYPLGGLSITGYRLEYRTAGENDFSRPWITISDNLDEESAVVKHLEPLGIYQFRVTAKNVFGFGEPSPASRMIQTHNKTAPKLNLDLLKKDYHFNVVSLPHKGALGDIMEEDAGYSECSTLIQDSSAQNGKKRDSRFNLELNTKDNPQARYQLDSEIFRQGFLYCIQGQFCSVRNAVDIKCETKAHCAAKICSFDLNSKENVLREYEILKQIQHTNVVQLLNAFMTLSGTHPFCSEPETTDDELKKNIVGEKCDINFIFTNASQEALRFVTNRMNTEEGLQHKWLSLLDVAIKRRENIKFSANNLRKFAQNYKSKRASKAATPQIFSRFDSHSNDQ